MKEKVERHSGGEYKVEYFESRDLSELLKEVVIFTFDVNISVNDILVFPSMDSMKRIFGFVQFIILLDMKHDNVNK